MNEMWHLESLCIIMDAKLLGFVADKDWSDTTWPDCTLPWRSLYHCGSSKKGRGCRPDVWMWS